jgi:hypothetical protein
MRYLPSMVRYLGTNQYPLFTCLHRSFVFFWLPLSSQSSYTQDIRLGRHVNDSILDLHPQRAHRGQRPRPWQAQS